MDLPAMDVVVGFLFFSFTAIFCLMTALVYAARLMRPWCDCHVCRAFLTSEWSKEFSNLSDWYSHLLSQSPTGTIHIHVLRNTITANPDNVEHILRSKFDNYPKGPQFSAILGDLLGRGIFNVDGHEWRFQRKLASLELGSSSICSFALDIVTAEVRSRLVPILDSAASAREHSIVDLQDVLRRFSFDNICKFSFGLDPGCLKLSLPVSEFAAAFDSASRASAERALTASPLVWKAKRLFGLGSERKLRDSVKLVNDLAAEMISLRRREARDDNSNSNHQMDLLSRFMASVDSDDKYLRDIVVSFVLAGRDTVSAALSGFFHLISRHPEAEKAIRAEVDRIMGSEEDSESGKPKKNRVARLNVPGPTQMRSMHYLTATIYESMRLYPPVQFDSKHCREDDVLPDGTFVRRGTRVTYHPYAMGRMERIWGPDCLQFKPERWLGPDGTFVPVCPYKYPVFQAGPRVCLGKEMAVMEMKAVAATLIRRFDIRVAGDGKEAPRFVPGLTATLRGGMPVTVHYREDQQ